MAHKLSDNQELARRYARQIIFGPIGVEGQKRISSSRVTLIGCGALGGMLAEMMTRAGVGLVRIVDRDFVELSNLQRQVLFDEEDIAANLPKAQAAAGKLRKINSSIEIEAVVADVTHENIEQFTEGANLILEGTDNLHTRFLINDVAMKHGIPWVYGACLGSRGMSMVILPEGRPCFRCMTDQPPEPGQLATCESAGILGPAVAMAAAYQMTEAIKILTGNLAAINRQFVTFDLWQNRTCGLTLDNLREGCVCCRDRQFDFLSGKDSFGTLKICGQKSVQVRPQGHRGSVDLPALAQRLQSAGEVVINEFLLKLKLPDRELTIFPDGRAIITGTDSIDEARSLYARFVGC